MKHTLPDGMLSQLSEMIAAKTALYFPQERWSDLEHKTGSIAKEFGFTGKEEFVRWLISSPLTPGQIDALASHLTIHETYFWREPQVFEALVTHILPELARSRTNGDKRLRIWSAGCATGEEPYSIAIALHRALPALREWNITILATDINPRVLRKATTGEYGTWSFRNAPQWLIDGYFHSKKDGAFELVPEIKKMVTFSYLNLAEDVYPAPLNNTNAMDIIFCRNVLMYFAPERIRQVGNSLYRSLVDGGWLMVSASELSQQIFQSFTPIHFPGAIVYRKETKETQTFEDFHDHDSRMIRPVYALGNAVEQPSLPFQLHLNTEIQTADHKAEIQNQLIAVLEQPAPVAGVAAIEKKVEETIPTKTSAIRELADQGTLSEALTVCNEALETDKLNAELHYLRAVILQELNRIEEAVASLNRTLYLDQNFLPAHFALGNLGLRQGNARAAKKHFENVLALLEEKRPEDILPESEGLTAGRFREIVTATMETGSLA